ncbi:MAG: PQQ-dependent sugar dehydrogenase [Proteobacteria bacterium]|nr:PQQ-dependent sugar dehydrogenase [Pseudomonadota bacterium]
MATGDGGTPAGNAQDINNLLGKILRIDVDGDDFPADPNANYAIPSDNPFAGATAGADEIWLMGLRNPWRFSFDRLNGDIFIGDVGEGAWEEVNHLSSGGIGGENFGWPCYEGVDEFNTTGCGAINEYVFPITALTHGAPPNNNLSVIGGYRYRGSQFSSLSGWYFYTDWATGFLWAAEPGAGTTWNAYNVASMGTFSVTGFGEGENGELYVIRNWIISQIIDPTDLIFLNGFE